MGALVLVCEVGLRLVAHRLSADVAHIGDIPRIARSMRSGTRPRILFFGNSLTRQGVDLSAIREVLQAGSSLEPVTPAKVYIDDTAVLDWYYALKHYFSGQDAPEYVVLGYVGNQLSDASTVHPDRIAGYFGGTQVAGELFANDLPDFGSRVDFALSSALTLFSEKERIRTQILSMVLPDYRKAAQRLNQAVSSSKNDSPVERYTRLGRLVRLCRERGIRLIIVAMPLPAVYPIDDQLVRTLGDDNIPLLDMRSVRGVSHDSFLDGFHLNPQGAHAYTRSLATRLRAMLSSDAQSRRQPSGMIGSAIHERASHRD